MSGRRPEPNEEVRLRRATAVFGRDLTWKVTSRYEVRVSAKKRMRCVRVSSLNGIVLHFSEKEFGNCSRRSEFMHRWRSLVDAQP